LSSYIRHSHVCSLVTQTRIRNIFFLEWKADPANCQDHNTWSLRVTGSHLTSVTVRQTLDSCYLILRVKARTAKFWQRNQWLGIQAPHLYSLLTERANQQWTLRSVEYGHPPNLYYSRTPHCTNDIRETWIKRIIIHVGIHQLTDNTIVKTVLNMVFTETRNMFSKI